MQGFLSEDMSGKIILDIIIPPLSEQANVRTYKVKAKFMIKTLLSLFSTNFNIN